MIYTELAVWRFRIWRLLFGFKNANRLLLSIDKRALIRILRDNGASIGSGCDINCPLIIHNCNDYRNLVIGPDCHVGKNVFLDLQDRITLESSCTVSMGTTIITHMDVGKSGLKSHGFCREQGAVHLEGGSYIGANATILHGVTVGSYAIVSAGAVVTSDVREFSVAGGVPARFIKNINRSR
jgi:acetyltransferase-like isoleucine patch superfamily enzyme